VFLFHISCHLYVFLISSFLFSSVCSKNVNRCCSTAVCLIVLTALIWFRRIVDASMNRSQPTSRDRWPIGLHRFPPVFYRSPCVWCWLDADWNQWTPIWDRYENGHLRPVETGKVTLVPRDWSHTGFRPVSARLMPIKSPVLNRYETDPRYHSDTGLISNSRSHIGLHQPQISLDQRAISH
jgi:hypothetical protein